MAVQAQMKGGPEHKPLPVPNTDFYQVTETCYGASENAANVTRPRPGVMSRFGPLNPLCPGGPERLRLAESCARRSPARR
jgi:hypothetical protein